MPADENDYPALAPDLVVEVVPSSRGEGLRVPGNRRAPHLGRRSGATGHVHRVDGAEQLLSDQDFIDGEDVLPGFRLPVARLFD